MLAGEGDGLAAVARGRRHGDAAVRREDRLEGLGEEPVVIGDQDTDGRHRRTLPIVSRDEARAKIQHLLVIGDNRLKQGVDVAKVRESFEQALEAAREAGLEDTVRPLVELRLADLERLAREPPPPAPPAA